jgi:hypothetical protein
VDHREPSPEHLQHQPALNIPYLANKLKLPTLGK